MLLVAVAPSVASAQDEAAKAATKAERQSAREAYDKGTKSFEKRDYAAALDSFVAANALIPSVQAMFWIAQSQDKLGHGEAAIEAYEAITARGDFHKLSADKSATVRERLAALKAAAAPPPTPVPPPEPAAEPPPAPAEPVVTAAPPPALPAAPPPLEDDDEDFLPKKNTAELGVMGGVLFVSPNHNLVEGNASHHEFDIPTAQIGARAAFFPASVFGVEAEWAHGFGSVKDGNNAGFDAVRGHLIGQLPTSRFVPFALLGAGFLRASSGDPEYRTTFEGERGESTDGMGVDTDFMLEAGIGFKVMATKIVVPRLDVRLGMTQAEGGGFSDGVALHPEILLGLSFVLGR